MLFFKKKGKKATHPYGQTVGIVWEYQGYHSREKSVCIVELKKEKNQVLVTIYDPNDTKVTSVTNVFEHIASGVYLEHLSQSYSPDQIQFFHRDAVGYGVLKWGVKTVQLTWDSKNQMFTDPQWVNWKEDEGKSAFDESFLSHLRMTAAVAVETYMRQRHEEGLVTAREKELYDAFQRSISNAYTDQKYNLRMDLAN